MELSGLKTVVLSQIIPNLSDNEQIELMNTLVNVRKLKMSNYFRLLCHEWDVHGKYFDVIDRIDRINLEYEYYDRAGVVSLTNCGFHMGDIMQYTRFTEKPDDVTYGPPGYYVEGLVDPALFFEFIDEILLKDKRIVIFASAYHHRCNDSSQFYLLPPKFNGKPDLRCPYTVNK